MISNRCIVDFELFSRVICSSLVSIDIPTCNDLQFFNRGTAKLLKKAQSKITACSIAKASLVFCKNLNFRFLV